MAIGKANARDYAVKLARMNAGKFSTVNRARMKQL